MEDKIIIDHIGKTYKMYKTPLDRLKEGISFREKSYHVDFHALTDISFSVKEGEILGIMGKNGAGKSTLLKIITGILKPTEGQVRVDGRISSLLELGAGFNMEYSGIDNIYFYGMLMKLTQKQIDERLDDIIEFAEIGDYVYQPVKTYSSGMFARLAFSCAINVEPDILIVDEILSVGDMRFQAKCFNKFKEFKKKGVTILYVGHDVTLMKKFCDTAIWMNQGRIVMSGDPAYVAAQYTEFMYVQDEETTSLDFEAHNTKMEDNDSLEVESEEDENTETTVDAEDKSDKSDKSITHWGTRKGMIKSVSLTDANGDEKDHYEPDEELLIKIRFEDDSDVDYENFSASFSIKNKEGLDLIVKSTYEEDIFFEHTDSTHEVSFKLKTYLATGDYYLVVALEDRKEVSILYYEYIEGVKFFKVYTDKKIYGIVDLESKIDWR